MHPIIIDDIAFKPSFSATAEKLHIVHGSDEYCELEELLDKAAAAAKPKAVYSPVFIKDSGPGFVVLDSQKMLSTVMPKNLKDVHRVFAYVATCGKELEQYSKSLTDMLHSWWMNTVMEEALRQIVLALRDRIKKDFGADKISSMSPGSLPDWPLSEQQKLFSLLGDVENLIGVTLTQSMLMIPAKTVSGFYFETETDYTNCQLCERQNCQSRRLPFDKNKSASLLGS